MTGSIKKREEIDNSYKWKLEDIYADEQKFEQDFNQVQELIKEENSYKGSLSNSTGYLLKALQWSEELERKTEKLYVYSRMRRDEDNSNHHYQALFDRVQ
ncbi:MAG: oligoendopeptidase F, partial [Syntrophomonas sp.]